MKFGISCEIDAKMFMENGFDIQDGKKNFIFYIDNETGRLKKVRIISEVKDASKYFYKKRVGIPSFKFGEDHGYEEELAKELVEDLQLLESTLALAGNLKQIYWQKSRFEYYPETEEENSRVEIKPAWFFAQDFTPDEPTVLNPKTLASLVLEREQVKHLVVPMAFYREGKNEYRQWRYINAFHNFYYVVEGLFGNGQFKTKPLTEELTKSPIFTGFVKNLIKDVSQNKLPADGLTRQQLEELLSKDKLIYNEEGIIRFIINERGRLHHFSIKSSQKHGTPFNQGDFKISSFLTLYLAGKSITHYLDKDINKKK